MTQHITQEVAIALAKQAELFSQFGLINGVVTKTVANVRVQELCNAAIQWDRYQHKAESPVLPEWSKQDNLGGLVPSEIRMSMRDFGQQCAAHARKLALEEAEKRMLTKAAELGIYNHHATKALVEALKGEVK